jgi:hypothetical protein
MMAMLVSLTGCEARGERWFRGPGPRVKAAASVVLLLLACACAGCASTRGSDPAAAATGNASPPLPNGIYAVLAETSTPTLAPGEGVSPVVLAYDRSKYGLAPATEPLTYVTVDRSGFVPLILTGTPEMLKDDNGRSMLRISLAHEQAKALEDFTRAHLGGRIATILDGEIITLHKIRGVIVGGEIQMTRCTDDACVIVRAKLVK